MYLYSLAIHLNQHPDSSIDNNVHTLSTEFTILTGESSRLGLFSKKT
jgi:hypothetical protein